VKHAESQWKPLEEEGAQFCAGKKWPLPNDKANRLTGENISTRRSPALDLGRMKL
jgi:hypothetical protein